VRIIGGHDYYDSALAYGRDDDILFVRDTLEVEHINIPLAWPNVTVFSRGRYENNVSTHEVDKETRYHRLLRLYVCGVSYTGVEIYTTLGYKEVIWQYDKLVEYAAKNELRIPKHRYWGFHDQNLEEFWNTKTTQKELDWLIDNRVAIAVGGYTGTNLNKEQVWYCNDAKIYPLRSLQFQKVIDPFTLFQELSMFVGNLPKDGPPMVQITDPDIKIAKHGFNKWSFRRHKDDAKQ
jgi:hypothetical protein